MENNELENKINKGAEEVRKIQMTPEEKERLLKNILGAENPAELSVASPYAGHMSFWLRIVRSRTLVYAGSSALFVVILAGGLTYASTGSLPGNILYSLKVNVLEPVRSALIFSPIAKAQYESELATERLIEAEILIKKDELDEEKQKGLSSLIEEHTENLGKAISKYREAALEEEEEDDNLVTEFQATMKAHAKILDILDEDDSENSLYLLKETEEKKAKETSISDSARRSADKIKHNKGKDGEKTKERYNTRKKDIQAIIDETVADLDQISTGRPEESQRIIDNTREILDQAKKLLEEGDENDRKGNFKDAYEKALYSESSAKEAKIFLKEAKKIEKEREKEERKGKRD